MDVIPIRAFAAVTGSGCASNAGRGSATGMPTMAYHGSTTASPAVPFQGRRMGAGAAFPLMSTPAGRGSTWFQACPNVHMYLALHHAPRNNPGKQLSRSSGVSRGSR